MMQNNRTNFVFGNSVSSKLSLSDVKTLFECRVFSSYSNCLHRLWDSGRLAPVSRYSQVYSYTRAVQNQCVTWAQNNIASSSSSRLAVAALRKECQSPLRT
jgi:hypothetical protein